MTNADERMNDVKQNPTQAQRRTRYGLNVTIAVVAALGVVVLLNLLAFTYLKQVRPIDLTATGQYSLSPQTRKVLTSIQADHEIVTLFGSADPELDPAEITRARDLVDQYARFGNRLKVDHINADLQTTRVEAFLARLHGRFQTQLSPIKTAIEKAQHELTQLREPMAQQQALLTAAATDAALQDETTQQFLTLAGQAFTRLDGDIESVNQQVSKALSGALPAYTSAKDAIEDVLVRLDERFYRPMTTETQRLIQTNKLPASVKEKMLAMVERITPTRAVLQSALGQLRVVQPVLEYDQVREQITNNPNPIVLMGTDKVRVLWLSQMFRRAALPPGQELPAGERPERLFQGEEHLTGALLAMQMDQMPMVVFISTGQRPATGPGGEYSLVAERLTTMNYTVRSWNPMGQMMAMGQRTPPMPPPEPLPGQKVVWVLTPSEQAGPMGFGVSPGEEQAVQFLQERLNQQGESAMVIIGASMAQRFGQVSPVLAMLKDWGMSVQNEQVIFREVTGPDGRARAQAQFQIDDWADTLPITQAMAGLRGVFLQVSPIELGKVTNAPDQANDATMSVIDSKGKAEPANSTSDVKHWPLVEITGRDVWADAQFERFPDIRRDPAKAKDRYIVAAAAQKGEQRLTVFADPAWATDSIIDYGALGPGTARLTRAVFPANAELFVNSVQWLAGLENLIAAGARTQDIRRVMALTDTQRLTINWVLLGGLPAVVIVAGMTVGLMRRKA